MFRRLLVLLLGGAMPAMAAAGDVALVTAATGGVNLIAVDLPRAIQPFSRLKQGDALVLKGEAGVRLIFFDSRREEVWRGEGRILIGSARGEGVGLAQTHVRELPELMARQIAKTPATDRLQPAPAGRLRSIEMGESSLARLDSDYSRLRKEAEADDINPEIFLLSGLFELREFDRLEQTLKRLGDSRPGNMELAVLGALYKKAIPRKQGR